MRLKGPYTEVGWDGVGVNEAEGAIHRGGMGWGGGE